MKNDSLYIPATLNDSPSGANSSRVGRSKKRKRSMQITYPQLRTAMQQHLEHGASKHPKQVFGNLTSALSQYLTGLAIPADATVGVEFRTSFYKLRARHLEAMRDEGRSEQSIRDRKSLLKRWRNMFINLTQAQAAENHAPSPFSKALMDALPPGITLKLIAKQAGVAYASLKRWRNGVLPSARSMAAVRRLERFLGLSAGQLTDYHKTKSTSECEDDQASEKTKAYRERLKACGLTPYRLNDVLPSLRTEWRELLDYKSSVLTFGLQRQARGRWKPSQLHPGKSKVEKEWFAFVAGGVNPTNSGGADWRRAKRIGGLWPPTFSGFRRASGFRGSERRVGYLGDGFVGLPLLA